MQPAGRLEAQPWMTAPASRRVVEALTRGGADARFVGGCVRDAVLGRPVKDIDIATHAPPDEVMRLLEAEGIRVIPTGLKHGTVTAVADHTPFEITTLRRDVETDGRHARVEFTDDWKADAARRDFTMNALFCAPDGTLFDPFGGIKDLKAGRVRFVGDARARIREDVLRLLRYFRFHAHYGRGAPDPEALAACRGLADRLPTLSGERVRNELLRLLTARNPAAVWRLMIRDGVMAHLLPVAGDTDRLARLVKIEDDLALAAGSFDPLRRLAALLRTDRDGALVVAERLRLSNQERDRLVRMAAPAVTVSLRDDSPARRRAVRRLGDSGLYLDLVLLAAAGGPDTVSFEDFAPARETVCAWNQARFPLTGQDVLALGVRPGPSIGRLLGAVEDWWIDNAFQPDREACLRELERRVAGDGDAFPAFRLSS